MASRFPPIHPKSKEQVLQLRCATLRMIGARGVSSGMGRTSGESSRPVWRDSLLINAACVGLAAFNYFSDAVLASPGICSMSGWEWPVEGVTERELL